jgi:excisionase family DNA binding protein
VSKSTPSRRLGRITLAAEYLGVSDKTVRRMIASGRLTGYRVGNRIIRVDLDEVEALLRRIPAAGDVA